MAQTLFSIARLLIGLLLNDESAWCTLYCFVWMIIDASILFCLELSSLFRWLVWISSIVNLMIIERYVGLIYSLFLMLLCDKRLKTEQFSRQYRRNTHLCTLGTSDERLMLLSGIRIYASLALFYSHAVHTLQSFWWDLIDYRMDTFDRLWVNLLEVKPPWPHILDRGIKILVHGILFLSVFPMVFERSFMTLHRKF